MIPSHIPDESCQHELCSDKGQTLEMTMLPEQRRKVKPKLPWLSSVHSSTRYVTVFPLYNTERVQMISIIPSNLLKLRVL